MYNDVVYRQTALNTICDHCDTVKASCPHYPCDRYVALEKLAPVYPTLYGYKFEHLATIASVLNKKGLTPDRVAEAIADMG